MSWQYRITTTGDPSATIYTVTNDVPPDLFAARLPVNTYVIDSIDLDPAPAAPVDPKPMQTPAQQWTSETVAPLLNNGLQPIPGTPATKAVSYVASHKKEFLIGAVIVLVAWKWR